VRVRVRACVCLYMLYVCETLRYTVSCSTSWGDVSNLQDACSLSVVPVHAL